MRAAATWLPGAGLPSAPQVVEATAHLEESSRVASASWRKGWGGGSSLVEGRDDELSEASPSESELSDEAREASSRGLSVKLDILTRSDLGWGCTDAGVASCGNVLTSRAEGRKDPVVPRLLSETLWYGIHPKSWNR